MQSEFVRSFSSFVFLFACFLRGGRIAKNWYIKIPPVTANERKRQAIFSCQRSLCSEHTDEKMGHPVRETKKHSRLFL